MILRFVSGVSCIVGSATGIRGILRWELSRRPLDWNVNNINTHVVYIHVYTLYKYSTYVGVHEILPELVTIVSRFTSSPFSDLLSLLLSPACLPLPIPHLAIITHYNYWWNMYITWLQGYSYHNIMYICMDTVCNIGNLVQHIMVLSPFISWNDTCMSDIT